MDIQEVLTERGSRYGRFADNSAISQMLKDVMHKSIKWESLSMDKKECLEMLCAKFSRILTGDPEYADNWLDCVGYLQLVIDLIPSSSASGSIESS